MSPEENPAFIEQLPLYVQVRDRLRDRIEIGEFMPGTAIPSEKELADSYGVSRMTIRSAIEELRKEGLLQPIQGKGVYVLGNKLETMLDMVTGFSQSIIGPDRNIKNSLVSINRRAAGPLMAGILKVDEDAELFSIKRLSSTEDTPVALEVTQIPVDLIPNLENLNLTDFSLGDIYAYYGLQVHSAEQNLDVVTLGRNEARLLGIKVDTPVFYFEGLRSSAAKPLDFQRIYVRPDVCCYTVCFKSTDNNLTVIPSYIKELRN